MSQAYDAVRRENAAFEVFPVPALLMEINGDPRLCTPVMTFFPLPHLELRCTFSRPGLAFFSPWVLITDFPALPEEERQGRGQRVVTSDLKTIGVWLLDFSRPAVWIRRHPGLPFGLGKI